ncbi:WecB/TagA/CpsF family glycosyltransferase [Phenylobacterium aquaticum]|uniref:WecB/TagA/CpsF family glycosyltransferase n=1 Tax=Phenylobacterium aquaticum TaxID=1763816 RepID=UPI0026F24865|nr:WecB/TagA/CpsF family glycosyltransferase [Phenylobacterium aquaticum]
MESRGQERRDERRRDFRKARRAGERIKLLGVTLDLVRLEEIMHHVAAHIAARTRFVVANHNAHSVYLMGRNPEFARYFDHADLTMVDSGPMVLLSRIVGLNARRFHRWTYLDWRHHFWSLANRHGWRVFYLGGAPSVPEAAAQALTEKYPNATIGVRNGYFDATPGSADNTEIVAQITAFQPDVIFVGMGMPRQEVWLLHHLEQLPPCVTYSIGAAFDYEAGVQYSPPRWAARWGFEWLARLLADPRRLFGRYCVEPWFLMGLALRDVAGAVRAGRLFKGFSTPAPSPPSRLTEAQP